MRSAAAARTELATRLVDALYTEALVLADEAYGYFDGPGVIERDALPPEERVHFACEALRVTTRLMHVIAWLLTRRAVAAGEISAAQGAAVDRRLGEMADDDAALLARLPAAARLLAIEAGDLYARVQRLDRGLSGDAAPPSPVTGLIARLEYAF